MVSCKNVFDLLYLITLAKQGEMIVTFRLLLHVPPSDSSKIEDTKSLKLILTLTMLCIGQ